MIVAQNLRAACLALTSLALAFTACGGSEAVAGSPSQVSVQVEPPAPQVRPGGTVAFTATVTGSASTSVQWEVREAGGGSIDASGLYQAPQVQATTTYHVVARSAADPTVAGTAVVTVTSTPQQVVAISISPGTATVLTGGTYSFSATVTGSSNTVATWSVQEAGGGSVSSTGTYTAPGSAGIFHVVATASADSTKTATATVTVTTPGGGGGGSGGGTVVGLDAQMAVLAQRAIFFEHASVGVNVEWGLGDLLPQVSGSKYTLHPSVYPPPDAGVIAASLSRGVFFGNQFPDLNGRPLDKVSTFESIISGGVGAKADIAMMKFCFVDLYDLADARGIFTAYKAAMDRLKAAYPSVKFVHWTMPLITDGADSNAARESFNAMIRSTYGGQEPVFDLALVESTRPDGSREIVGGVPALYPGYTTDGGHLSGTGYDKVARALVALLANL
jgi:hypothetical protein